MAYVDAIAGKAGVNVTRSLHDYGVDGTFHPIKNGHGGYTETGFTVEYQLKATINWELKGDEVIYDLEASAYNKLVGRNRYAVPYVIIVMCLPRVESRWLRQNERAILLTRSCYWYWQPNGPATKNTGSIRISIPRRNHLTATNLANLLQGAEAYQRGMQNHV